MHTGLSVPEGYGIGYDDAVALARDHGCEFLEVLMDGRGRPETIVDELAPALEERPAASASWDAVDGGLDLVVHLPFTVPLWSPIDAYQDGLDRTHRACLDAASDLGAVAAVVHPESAAMGDAFDDDGVVLGVLDAVRDLHEYGATRDVDVIVENLQSGPFGLDGLARVADETPASLVLDTGHARCSGHDLDDVLAFVDAYHDDVAHLHLNDTRGANDEHLPLGAGTVDFEAFLGAFAADWNGRVCVEAVVASTDALAASLDHLDGVLERLERR